MYSLPDTIKLQTGAKRASEVLITWEGDSSSSNGLLQYKNITQRQKAVLCSVKRLLLTRHENIRHPNVLRILLLASPQRANTSWSSGRIVVMMNKVLDPEVESRLRSEISQVCAFISVVALSDSDIQFLTLEGLEEQRGGGGTLEDDATWQGDPKARVVVMAFNRRCTEGEKNLTIVRLAEFLQHNKHFLKLTTVFRLCLLSSAYIGDPSLAEICESDNGPVSWLLCGEPVSVSWVRQDEGDEFAERATCSDGLVIVCNESKSSAVRIYYPKETASFFAEQSLLSAFKPENFLGRKLSPEVGQIFFKELQEE